MYDYTEDYVPTEIVDEEEDDEQIISNDDDSVTDDNAVVEIDELLDAINNFAVDHGAPPLTEGELLDIINPDTVEEVVDGEIDLTDTYEVTPTSCCGSCSDCENCHNDDSGDEGDSQVEDEAPDINVFEAQEVEGSVSDDDDNDDL